MKIFYKLLIISQFFLLFFLSFTIRAQSDVESIRDVMKMQEVAWNKGDIPSFMNGYWKSDSLLFIGSNGINRGWNNTLERYKRSYPTREKMGKLRFELESIELISTERAHVIGQYFLADESGVEFSSGYFTLLWRKVDNNWVIMIDQTCG